MESRNTRKRLIVNADDYGLSRGTVDGIIQCVQAGIVTSTSIMATGEAFEYGLERIAELKTVSLGVHLDTTTGTPLSPPSEIPSLVDGSGGFHIVKNAGTVSAMRPAELEREFRRQIRRVIDAKVAVTHLDNHLNWIYFSPLHFRVLARLAREHGLALRFPFGTFSAHRVAAVSQMTGLDEIAVEAAAESCRRIIAEEKVRHTSSFWSDFTSSPSRSFEVLHLLLEAIPFGISEICVHPGLDTDRQQQELRVLLAAAAENAISRVQGLEPATYAAVGRGA